MKSSNRFVALVATLMVLVPVAVSASDSFTDVADSDVFHNDIDWLAQADVTRGCNPPANDRFCPKDFVTREQMAAFMHRLAGNEVVDAADSQLLDGLDSTAFLQTNEDAANSDLLDGLDSSDFVNEGTFVTATQTESISVSRYQFMTPDPTDANDQILYDGDGARLLPGSSEQITAPVSLPDGARIVSITLYAFDDNGAVDGRVRLSAEPHVFSPIMPINTDFAETDGVGGEQVASYAYPVPAIVDNDVNSYRIVAGPPGGGAVWPGNQVAVWSVVVTYEIDRLIEVSH